MGRNQPAAKGPSTARSQAHCSTPALQGFRKLPFRPLLVPFLDARAKGPRTTGRSGSAPGSGVPRRCRHTDLPRRPGKPHGRTPLPPPRTAVRHKTRRSPPGLPAGGGTAPRDEASPSAHGPCPARTRTHTHTHTHTRARAVGRSPARGLCGTPRRSPRSRGRALRSRTGGRCARPRRAPLPSREPRSPRGPPRGPPGARGPARPDPLSPAAPPRPPPSLRARHRARPARPGGRLRTRPPRRLTGGRNRLVAPRREPRPRRDPAPLRRRFLARSRRSRRRHCAAAGAGLRSPPATAGGGADRAAGGAGRRAAAPGERC